MSREFASVEEFKEWFEQHVTLGSKPYALDSDQARAVLDDHKNTLVTARAGSGKTRVIVAKIAYLVANSLADLHEIAAFMFNRTAAAEVNERIGAVAVDGVELKNWYGKEQQIRVASTFHKFALDLVKLSGDCPELISESERSKIIHQSLQHNLRQQNQSLTPQRYEELLRLVSSFISRAGQKYAGKDGVEDLREDVEEYCHQYQDQEEYRERILIHQLCLATFNDYLLALRPPKMDFNLLMSQATQILQSPAGHGAVLKKVAPLKYIMVDEYQDFSFLFFSIIQALRGVCPKAHLFAVGDDWQAINRFAGSDVNYFINFADYFYEDNVNIPLMTNYRSDRQIVENANEYMLKYYNPQARRAIPFSKKRGKIKRVNPAKTKFDKSDIYEDGLHDARFQRALAQTCGGKAQAYTEAAQLLKTVYKLMRKHRKQQILLLHRHNFTSFQNVTLDRFLEALKNLVVEHGIMTENQFKERVRGMTMHKSKGLESDAVILLEANRDQVLAQHHHAETFTIFGDCRASEKADQHRLLYVALTRAKHRLYILTTDKRSPLT